MSRYVSAKEFEFPADFGAFEEFGGSACEGSDALGVGEGAVEFGGWSAEFFGGVYGGGVYRGSCFGCACCGCVGCGGDSGWRVYGSWFQAFRRVFSWCVLDVFSMLGDEGGTQFGVFGAQLGEDFGAEEVFDGRFGQGVGVDIYVELWKLEGFGGGRWIERDIQRTRLLQCRELPLEW